MGLNKKFFVNNGGQNLGPFDLEMIFQKVSDEELKATDHIYLEDKDEWILICQHPEFKPIAKVEAPIAELPQETGISNDEWFVLKGKNRYGPYPYAEMIKMLQDKIIFEFDYTWRQGLSNWLRLAEVEEFAADRVRTMIHELGKSSVAEVFSKRKHPRSSYECPVVIHDNTRVWKGKSIEVSEGGAGLIMENAMILPGQSVYLHFKPGPNSKPFNVLCEVVSKRYVKGIKDKNTPIVYGIKFINIQKQDKDELKTLSAAA
jgi:hypothetical protein